jgi:hypothetical protein
MSLFKKGSKPVTQSQLNEIHNLAEILEKIAGSFFGKELDVLTAASLEFIVPRGSKLFCELSEVEASKLILWMRRARIDAGGLHQQSNLFGGLNDTGPSMGRYPD